MRQGPKAERSQVVGLDMGLGDSGKALLLIIDVQSKQGSVEEVCVRDGDSAYCLAEDFVLRWVNCFHIGSSSYF